MHGSLRKTKIIATLGPPTDSREMLGRLIDAGAGTHAYLIKAVTPKTTGSGSYYNLSQGAAALAQ